MSRSPNVLSVGDRVEFHGEPATVIAVAPIPRVRLDGERWGERRLKHLYCPDAYCVRKVGE